MKKAKQTYKHQPTAQNDDKNYIFIQKHENSSRQNQFFNFSLSNEKDKYHILTPQEHSL